MRLDEREQFLRPREAFEDETLLADLMLKIGLDAIDTTSVTSYMAREILV